MKTITIGRGPENMVTLDDPQTSRHHALLRCYPLGKIEIVDLSQNGTFVNGISNLKRLYGAGTRYRRFKLLILSILALLVAIIAGAIFLANRDKSITGIENAPASSGISAPIPQNSDSLKNKEKQEDIEKRFVFPQKSKDKKNKGKSENKKVGNKKEDNNKESKDEKQEQEQFVL